MSPRSPRRRPSQRRRSDFARVRAGIGEVLELSVGEPAHGGACVARDASGRVVFVRHTAPGEVVRARVTAVQKNLAWADAVEIVSTSADRVESVWPQAGPGGVGGGELAHLRPAAQREWKQRVIAGQLRRVGGEALAEAVASLGGVHVAPAVGDEDPSDPLTGRRSRIDVVIDEAGRAGMHEFRGRRVIALDDMPLAVPAIRELGLFDEETPWRHLWKPGERVRAVAPSTGAPIIVIGQDSYAADGTRIDVDTVRWDVPVAGTLESYDVRPSGFWQTHVRGAEVLDLFAGTGQLGIEALSRGAAHCDFVEHNKTAYGIVSKNVESARVKDKAALHRTEAAEFVSKAGRERYDVIFLDPPYGGVILENALKQIETFDILSVNGIIICESAVEDRFSHGFAVVRERRYGATMITILQRQSGETE